MYIGFLFVSIQAVHCFQLEFLLGVNLVTMLTLQLIDKKNELVCHLLELGVATKGLLQPSEGKTTELHQLARISARDSSNWTSTNKLR
jgi:stage III sporulation protein SpoIIIAA